VPQREGERERESTLKATERGRERVYTKDMTANVCVCVDVVE